MFEKIATEKTEEKYVCSKREIKSLEAIGYEKGFKDGAEFAYKTNEWHYVKDGDLPRQDGHSCFSIEVLASNKKWVYYQFDSGKWFCRNKEVNVLAWKEIVFPFPELKECE